MFAIPADKTLLKALASFLEPVEVHDTTGKLLGLFVPANLEKCKQLQAEFLSQIVDWDEIECHKQLNEPTHAFKETLAWLKKLEEEVRRREAAGEKALTTDEGLAYFRSLRQGA
jgi:hypothetical protein